MKKKLTDLLYSFSLLLFVIAFNFQHNPPEGWYQQFLPDIGGRQIRDITFTDSLNGYAVTTRVSDTSYILRTTNGGDNWFLAHADSGSIFNRVQFINHNTGFVGGLKIVNFSFLNILKTTNAGVSWSYINAPFDTYISDMSVLNEDTIWFANASDFVGGVFRTTNGGLNWTLKSSPGDYPDKIYMYNSRIGFIGFNGGTPTTKRTTNEGLNWTTVLNEGFTDMVFIDSLTGWKCWGERDSIKHTTDGGISWQKQLLPPSGGLFQLSIIERFSVINSDTIWGVGARGFTSLGFRGLIYVSTNGGETWGYQLPDTNNITIGRYSHIQFIDGNCGWAYTFNRGVHTVKGGDTTYYITSVNQVGNEIPSDYILHQNFPNPFNPTTKIKYELKSGGIVKLKVFDIRGKEVSDPVNENQQPGVYEVNFSASEYGMVLSSGIYFYSLYIDDRFVDTKKMLLIR